MSWFDEVPVYSDNPPDMSEQMHYLVDVHNWIVGGTLP